MMYKSSEPPSPKTALSIIPETALSIIPAAAPPASVNQVVPPARPVLNPVALLLQDQRKETTRRAYKADLSDLFGHLGHGPAPAPETVRLFVGQTPPELALALAGYRAAMLGRGLSPATINRRLAAVRSLLKFSFRLGFAQTDGRSLVDSEKAEAYRDTRGTSLDNLKKLLALPNRQTLKGKRDFALLRLLADNALRRAEVWALDVNDFAPTEMRLAILGKGKSQKQFVTLYPSTARAIQTYLAAAGHAEGALFRNVAARASVANERLTADALDDLIRTYGRRLGLKLSPHKLRHTAITAALEQTGGDVRRVQKFSRHAKIETLMIYDDNRVDVQGEVTTLLGKLLDE